MTEDEMVGWHHQLDGHEFEQAPGVGDGQGSLACCSPAAKSLQSCPTLCDCMECSMPGLPVLHHLPELAQTHDHLLGEPVVRDEEHVGPERPSPTPEVYPNSHPLSW